ncbi:MAG: cytochrome c3 family protein [Armatimonadota bacterium]
MAPMKIYDLLQSIQQRLGLRTTRVLTLLFKFGVLGVLGVVILGAVGIEFSSTPRFCVSCHYMKPYYDSWQQSSHKDVRCIECHFPPGIKSELSKKFQALVQVAKYVTRQYGTRPWTQVEDASCLRSGCHETRLLRGKVKFNGVEFDHLPHLTSYRRMTKLRCTSCHSQLVQGKHMTVTASSCYLCHFKTGHMQVEMGDKNLADCTLCHKQPITTKNGKFDHAFVKDRGVDCAECHSNVTHGDGDVPQERCSLCHSEQKHIERYNDVAFIHENHVTEYKIECSQCHNAIQHSLPKDRGGEFLSRTRSGECDKCHDSQHDVSALLYAGQGGKGVKGPPDFMFEAGVTCESCHRTYESQHKAKGMPHAGAAGCMMCHGEKYGEQLAQWRAEFGEPVNQRYTEILAAKRQIATRAFNAQHKQAALTLIGDAEENVRFVKEANGVHNPRYARELLQTATKQANEALAMAGLAKRITAPAATPVKLDTCATCHAAAPSGTRAIFGVQFSHTRHVDKSGLACSTCHTGGLPEQAGHGKLRLTEAGCRTCHDKRAQDSPHAKNWKQSHGAQAKQNSKSCAVCHSSNTCTACHGGVAMPHGKKWIGQHGAQANTSPEKCSKCHDDSAPKCATCHKNLSPSSHKQEWGKKHPTAGKNKPKLCEQCHAKSKGKDSCTTCHGVQMPHPESFAMEHAPIASFAKDSKCFKCHDRAKFCSECHEGN